MNRRLRQTGLGIVLAVVVSILIACGGTTGGGTGATGGTPGPAAGATAAPATGATAVPATGATVAPVAATAPATGATAAPAAGGGAAGGTLPANCTNVDLQYWNPFTGPDGPFMEQLTDRFNAEHPNIKVTMTSQAEYYTQLGTAAASGTLPDVMIVHADQIATQAFRNVIRPIDTLVQDMNISGNDFPAAVWEVGEVAGQRYAVPLDIHPAVLYYNADMLQAAGISAPPKTAQEFEQAATALTQGNTKGFLLTSGFFSQQIFQMLLHQFGGTEFSEDASRVTWNSDAGVRALQWMKDAQQRYGEPNLETDAEINGFKAGNAAMMINGIWQLTNVTGQGVEFQGRGTAVPQLGSQPAVWAGSHQLALPVQANADPCKEAAAGLFIRYLTSNSLEWSRAGQIPASNSVRNSTEFKAIEPQASIAPSVENAFFPPSVPGITDALGPLGEAVSSVMAGTETDIKAALDQSAQRAEQILTENRNNYGTAPGNQ